MTGAALKAFVLAGLIACAGCAGRAVPITPSAAPPAPVPSSAPKTAVEPPREPGGSAVPVAGQPGSAPAPAAAPAQTPETAKAANPAPGEAPPATASGYVFSPQQVASASPSAPAPAGQSPVESKPTPAPATAPAPKTAEPPRSNPAPRGTIQLSVMASASEIASGEIVTVDVMAFSDAAVVDAPLHIDFDPKVVAFVDSAPGDFLAQGGSSVVFLADGLTRPGDVAVAVGRVERAQGAQGAGLLCRVRLKGIAPGSSPLLVSRAKAWGTRGETLDVLTGGSAVGVR